MALVRSGMASRTRLVRRIASPSDSLVWLLHVCRPEAVGDLLQFALPVLLTGLQDRDDSVQAAAAEALVPLAPMLLQMQADDVSAVQC